MRLTKLMVIGKAKAIYMALEGDGKSEIGATEDILESHVAPASPGFQHHTLGDKESFCRQVRNQGQQQTNRASPLWLMSVSPPLLRLSEGD